MRRLTSKEFSRVTGIPEGSILGFRQEVGITPDLPIVQGRKAQTPFTVQQALAAACWRGLLKLGVRREDAAAVSRHLWHLPTEHLEADFVRGARFILIVGGFACPRLLTADAIRAPEGIPPELAASLQPVAVDAQKLLNGIISEVSKEAKAAAS
jgi:hypothetical protein